MNVLNHIQTIHKHHIIMGDFNAHSPIWSHKYDTKGNGKTLEDYLQNNIQTLINITAPTYYPTSKKSKPSLLDLCIASRTIQHRIHTYCHSASFHSDHVPFCFQLDTTFASKKVTYKHKVRTTNWPDVYEQLQQTTFHPTPPKSPTEIEQTTKNLTNLINDIIDKNTSTRIITINSNKILALPTHIITLIKQKRQILRKYQRSHQKADHLHYLQLKRQVQQAIQIFKYEK